MRAEDMDEATVRELCRPVLDGRTTMRLGDEGWVADDVRLTVGTALGTQLAFAIELDEDADDTESIPEMVLLARREVVLLRALLDAWLEATDESALKDAKGGGDG